ncbi:hypothetical protein O181_119888, partial [Austropuccinia psidii MF-1]|nr:hypothetical protein [Austropuccinia psidii MF-1]
EETLLHFFIAKGTVHIVLGRPFLADNNIRLEFSHKLGEILNYQEADGRRLCMPICKPQALGGQTGQPRGMDLCNMAKLQTQELSIYAKSDKFGHDLQNNQWPNNLKILLEDSISEDELPKIIYKPIDNTKETFQIFVDGNAKINGKPLKTKPKRKKVRFSEHHELSYGEIIKEIEKDFKIMEERDKSINHRNFLDRPLNNQEEPY